MYKYSTRWSKYNRRSHKGNIDILNNIKNLKNITGKFRVWN